MNIIWGREVVSCLGIVLDTLVHDMLKEQAITSHDALAHVLFLQFSDTWVVLVDFRDKSRCLLIQIFDQFLIFIRLNLLDKA